MSAAADGVILTGERVGGSTERSRARISSITRRQDARSSSRRPCRVLLANRSTLDERRQKFAGLTSILRTTISHFTIGLAIWCKPCHRSRRARPPALYRGASILRSHDYRDGRDYRVTREKTSFALSLQVGNPPPRELTIEGVTETIF